MNWLCVLVLIHGLCIANGEFLNPGARQAMGKCLDTENCCSKTGAKFLKCCKKLGCCPVCNKQFLPSFVYSQRCKYADECCKWPDDSAEFAGCCSYYGCCPFCHKHKEGCEPIDICITFGGTCRDKCWDFEHQIKLNGPSGVLLKTCSDESCKCCTPIYQKNAAGNCGNEIEKKCCKFDAGTTMYYECGMREKCFPMCKRAGCHNYNKLYSVGETMHTVPEKCYMTKCSLFETDNSPYYLIAKEEITMAGCDCCYENGVMYANGSSGTKEDGSPYTCTDGTLI